MSLSRDGEGAEEPVNSAVSRFACSYHDTSLLILDGFQATVFVPPAHVFAQHPGGVMTQEFRGLVSYLSYTSLRHFAVRGNTAYSELKNSSFHHTAASPGV
jgi:hypothetical protein